MKQVILFFTIILCITLGIRTYLAFSGTSPFYSSDISTTTADTLPMLNIHFMDIGQGDATFVEFPDGEQMLVDCSIDNRVLEALGRNMPFYDNTIDYLVVTHPDLDHYGGCVDVMKRFDIGHIIYNGLEKPYDELWQSFQAEIQAQKAKGVEFILADHPFVWDIASTTVQFLYPDHAIPEDAHIPGLEKDVGANGTSVVIKLSYGDEDALLMGDAEEELEEYLIQTYGDQLDVDVLKMGHHGSQTASSQAYIDATSPAVAIASCGLNNKFGHPSPRVLKRFERAGTQVWRTDSAGDILVSFTTSSYHVESQF